MCSILETDPIVEPKAPSGMTAPQTVLARARAAAIFMRFIASKKGVFLTVWMREGIGHSTDGKNIV